MNSLRLVGYFTNSNIDYSTRLPVILTFSRNVGEILSEYRAKSLAEIPEKYRYFI